MYIYYKSVVILKFWFIFNLIIIYCNKIKQQQCCDKIYIFIFLEKLCDLLFITLPICTYVYMIYKVNCW